MVLVTSSPSSSRTHARSHADGTLASQPTGFILPQIGLALPQGDELSKVGAGAYSAQIAELVAGLRVLARPACEMLRHSVVGVVG